MPKTCSTCTHWKPMPVGARSDGPIGECRERSPAGDFKWPRTRDTEYCSRHHSGAAYATGPATAPTPAPARPEPHQLSLVADPAAPTPAETGKNPQVDAPGSTRQRSAKASPKKPEAPAPSASGRTGDE